MPDTCPLQPRVTKVCSYKHICFTEFLKTFIAKFMVNPQNTHWEALKINCFVGWILGDILIIFMQFWSID